MQLKPRSPAALTANSRCALLAGLTPREFMQSSLATAAVARARTRSPRFAAAAVAYRTVRSGGPRRRRVAPRSATPRGRLGGRDTGRSRAHRCRRCGDPVGRCSCRASICITRPRTRLLQAFRFVPDARLDDLMVSWATDGGGVGAHVDSYDVFLLQAQGRRRWRIARRYDATLDERAPLKVLRHFVAEQEFVLEPGDLLYLPPHWAHEGTAVGGDCMTCSIGMRAPQRGSLAAELCSAWPKSPTIRCRTATRTNLPRPHRPRYRTRSLHSPAKLSGGSRRGRAAWLERSARCSANRSRRSGSRNIATPWRSRAVALDRRTRMLYDQRHLFINGESVAGPRHRRHRVAPARRRPRARCARGARREQNRQGAARRVVRGGLAAHGPVVLDRSR